MANKQLTIDEPFAQQIVGPNDSFIRRIMSNMNVEITIRAEQFTISGTESDVDETAKLLLKLKEIAQKNIFQAPT